MPWPNLHDVVKQWRAEGRCYSCGAELTDAHKLCGDCRAYHRSRKREVRAERQASGLCLSCATPADGQYCESCKAKVRERWQKAKERRLAKRRRSAERTRRRATEKHAAGLCWRCSTPVPDGRWVCLACCRQISERATELRQERRAAGLCKCGRKPRAGYALCARCAEERRRLSAALRDRRLALGQCVECDRPRVGARRCAEHMARQAETQRRLMKRKRDLQRATAAQSRRAA